MRGTHSSLPLFFYLQNTSVLTKRFKKWPSVDEDLARNCLTELDPYNSMG